MSLADDRNAAGDKPDYEGHWERLRERFLAAGSKGMHDYELLELLLTYAVQRRDVKRAAKKLLERFGSVAGVLDASVEELQATKLVTRRGAALFRLVKELCGEYLAERMTERDVLSSPQTVVDFARVKLGGQPNETFLIIYLNAKHEVIDHDIVQEGTVDRAVVYPRRIIEKALGCHAAGLVLVHNHPSGHAEPSPEDKQLTAATLAAARTMDIDVVDHLVVGKDSHFSFREYGLLP